MNNTRYTFAEQLQTDSRFVTYRARQQEDGKSVILKLPKNPHPTPIALNKLKGEFAILSKATHPGIVAARQIEPFENGLALVLEDSRGAYLTDLIRQGPLELDTFFPIAISLAESVSHLHRQRIMHKNIHPGNVIIPEGDLRPKLTGFGLAAELSREALPADAREVDDTLLAYISPEQTGRISRMIDQRTDLYSLGAVYFEMLTQRPLFMSEDPLEMIHNHLARTPPSVRTLRSDVPEVLDQIISRLLAKNADDRYQSAAGLLADLKLCFESYLTHGRVENFVIAQHDISDQFRLPDKLYGRADEIALLEEAYRQALTGHADMVMVTGYSGVGKSKLVAELKKSAGYGNGYFISGKFDQFKRDIPLSSLISAFRELLRQILSESDEQVERWKKLVLKAVGSNGRIITDVIPEAENLIGPQPPVANLPAAEATNRFNRVFSRFVRIFAQPGNPLCIFLDDLQWIDSATRQWIERHLTEDKADHLLLIGAYRDNETPASHPIMLMQDRLQQAGVTVRTIKLQPLDRETLRKFVGDTLLTTPDKCQELANLVHQKTNGNPFFTRQCMLSLHEKGAIAFNAQNARWTFDLAEAARAEISDNVVELMTGQIDKLPADTRQLLISAACIGNRFSLSVLQKVSGLSQAEVAANVETAVQHGLVIPVYAWNRDEADDYRYLHDRVQQAALTLLPEDERKQLRLHIAQLLLDMVDVSEKEEKIYEIADHLNYAISEIKSPEELMDAVRVNLAASLRAKNATAYETALHYIRQAMDHAPGDLWEEHSPLTRDLYLQRAEAEHLSGYNEAAEPYYDMAINVADGVIEKAKIYQRKIHYYTNTRNFNAAYQTGREAVGMLGIKLPSRFFPPQLIGEVVKYQYQMRNRKIADLINLKEMEDERLKMAILLMATFARAAYQIRPELCVTVCAKMVNTCLRHGNTDGGFIGYLAFGPIFMGAILGKKQTGYDIGELTLALVDKYNSLGYKSETHFVTGYFAIPWRKSAIEMERYWQVAYEAGLDTGDYFHTSCAVCGTIQSYFMRGVPFDEIEKAAARFTEFLSRIHNSEGIATIQSVTQAIKNLRGETIAPDSLSTEDFDEEAYVDDLANFSSRHFAHYYYINKARILYLRGHYQKAYDIIRISDRYLKDSPGMLHTAEHFFYKALIFCAVYSDRNPAQKAVIRRNVNSILKKFRRYARGCADNFIHKLQILEAEVARIEGRREEAERFYELAMESAVKYNYLHLHALTNLLASRLHQESGRRRLAIFHLRDACHAWFRLGAVALAKEIIQPIPELHDLLSNITGTPGSAPGSTAAISGTNLDLSTVVKSAEAISREIRLHDLITSLMKIISENAGAERMVLLLMRRDQLVIEAEYFVREDRIQFVEQQSLNRYVGLSRSVVQYVAHTQQPVILENASSEGNYVDDPYFQANDTRSVLVAPLVQQGKLMGVVYLENNLTPAAFTRERIDLLILLSGQIAVSIENALHYETLEEKVEDRTRQLNEEKNKSDSLLLNILPAETAEELKQTGTAKAKDFDLVTVMFTDFKNFTTLSSNMSAQEVVSEIHYCYTAFDNITSKYGIEKIKTIGDSYMCVGGLPVTNTTHAVDTLKAALEIRDFMAAEKKRREAEGKTYFELRIGLHSGPVVAGIVGTKKFAYDIWGDTVNVASRMESGGETGKINISGATYELVKDYFDCTYRGKVEAKNAGLIDMYFVNGLKQ